MKSRRRRADPRPLPRIGPCRDPLCLWYLEYADGTGNGIIWRRYYANRAEARQALAARKSKEA